MAQALIVVSVLALSACGGSPSVDALDAVSRACITTQGLHYDIDANMAAPGQRIGYTIQVAGADGRRGKHGRDHGSGELG